ncbi:MAG: secondary thiamine-phosphate synthase enzyme YjbQ [Pseudomonadota bacterium]
MKSFISEIKIDTKGPIEFVDITGRVRSAFEESGIREGLVTVFTSHTTAAVKINERCDRLQEDMLAFLENAVPASNYRHDEDTVDSRANARSHLMSLLLNASETVPASGGKLMLGTWQTLFFIELDGPRRGRSVSVGIIGE